MSSGTWEVWSLTSKTLPSGAEQSTGRCYKTEVGQQCGVHSGNKLESEWGTGRAQRDFSTGQHLNRTLKDRISINGEGGGIKS